MRKRFYIIGSSFLILSLFMIGLLSGAERAYVKERNDILSAMDQTSKEYTLKAELLLKERSHCSMASEIEKELTRLQEINNARRNQLSLMDSITGNAELPNE